jgi:hypothetical protein
MLKDAETIPILLPPLHLLYNLILILLLIVYLRTSLQPQFLRMGIVLMLRRLILSVRLS